MTHTQTFNDWITCPKPNPQAKLRLFCFPYAGGAAWNFRTWHSNLPTNVEVCALELPGRGTRILSSPFTRMELLVKAIAIALQPYLDKPFAFFGHSMGALVSFEVSRFLRREWGIFPVHLFVSGRRAPQIPNSHAPIYDLQETEFLEKLRAFNGTPAEVLEHKELMELMIPILRADFAVLETYLYTPEPPLACPIAVFGGLQDRDVSGIELEAWREQTHDSFQLQMFPGDHFFLHSARSLLLQSLAQQIS
ncbi:putative thioesterase [Hydrococcus rivularis NIES-593]|uniref:Putative thioesterase n=1 Tax=Hydrococcus rivularis NIES-593 TaxID=1921803 RepID=A0A1U7HBB2_9CYAN|nr:thioesterase II family protein [Hydrococcus rivularis]OKH20892.1 putative thioesterase [Hydrococcus rivularis NIES-593]